MSSDERFAVGLWPSRRSLAWKIAVWGAVGSVTIVLAFGIALYLAMMAQVRSIDEQVLLKRALRVRDVIQTSQSVSEWLGHEVSEDLEAPRQVFIRVIGADTVMLAETPGMADMAPAGLFPQPSALGRRASGDITGAGRHLRALTLRVVANGLEPTREAIIQVAVDTSIDERLLGQFRGILLIALPLAAFACIVLAAAVASRFLKPLRTMTRDAEQLDAAEVGARLSVHGGAGEIAELARAFNGVLIRLEEARERLKHYADTIAHEIRTPLNRMLLNTEIALREKRSAADYEEIIEAQAQECSALSHLAQRLLFLARAESSDIVYETPAGAGERNEMIAALTTNLTRFYREPHHFEHLRKQIVERLMPAAKRGARVRLWSAACSSGEEPYSMALTLLDVFPDAARHDVKILATDIDPNMVARARRGVYSDEGVSPIPAAMRERCLSREQDGPERAWRVKDEVRALLTFKELNLIGNWPMQGKFDIIFCRNVVIYFEEPTQIFLWERFKNIMNPDGRLYIGHSERCDVAGYENDGLTVYKLGGGAR